MLTNPISDRTWSSRTIQREEDAYFFYKLTNSHLLIDSIQSNLLLIIRCLLEKPRNICQRCWRSKEHATQRCGRKSWKKKKKEEGWLNTVGSARAIPPVRPGNRERERETSLSPLFGGKKGREIPRKTRLHCSLLTSTIVGDLSSHGELHEKYFCCRMNKENGQPL